MKGIIKLLVLTGIIFIGRNWYYAKYAEKIVGTWSMVTAYLECNKMTLVEYMQVFSADGKASANGKITYSVGGQFVSSAVFEIESDWSVKSNTLFEIPTEVKMSKYTGDSDFFTILDLMKKEVGVTLKYDIRKMKSDYMSIEDAESHELAGFRRN